MSPNTVTSSAAKRAMVKMLAVKFNANEPGWRSRYSDSLRTGRSGDRILVGVRFSAPIQTGSEAHPASSTMCTGFFPGVKVAGAWR